MSANLAQPAAPADVVQRAWEALDGLNILVCNHAKGGGDGSIFDMDAATMDEFYAVNTRSTVLLTKEFARRFAPTEHEARMRPGTVEARHDIDENALGSVIWMTSGQVAGPMPGEVAYVASKAALAGLTSTAASELLRRGVRLNTVNPGPVNTGYLDPETADRPIEEITHYVQSLPMGRFGAPEDPARLIAWLVSHEARWVVGEVISTEGGFRL